MRLNDLERKQINEAAQALALPVIGLISPAAANVMLNALGLGATALAAYYTSKEIDKLKVNYSGAWENISNALAQTAEQIEKGALIANPMIMTALMLQKFQADPKSFNNQETVDNAIKSASAESMRTEVGPRPEITASGGRAKKNQLADQAAWDAAYGQTHLFNGKVNTAAGKIDPGLVRAQAALSAKIEADAQSNKEKENSVANTIANTTGPEIHSDTLKIQNQTNNAITNSGITSFNPNEIKVNTEISKLAPVTINNDKAPNIGTVDTSKINVGDISTLGAAPSGGDISGVTTTKIDPPVAVPTSAPKLDIPKGISANTSLNVPGYTGAVKVQSVSPRGIVATTSDGETVNFRTQSEIDDLTINKVTPTLANPISKVGDNDITFVQPGEYIGQNDLTGGKEKDLDATKANQGGASGVSGANAGDAGKGAGVIMPPIAIPGARSGVQTGANTSNIATTNTGAKAVATTKTSGAPPGKGKKIGGFKLPKIPGAKGLDMDLIKWQELEPSDPLGLRTMGRGGEK